MRKFLLLIVFLVLPAAARAQAIVPICNGDATHDTAQFVAIEAMQGSVNSATIGLPHELDPAQRCKVNTLTLTANLTLDDTDGSGIFVVTGQTLTIAGPIVSSAKPFFFNATATLGKISFAGNKTVTKAYPEWWGAVADGTTNNAAFLNAANAALVTILSGEIELGPGNYSFNSTLTLGTPPFTAISLGGTSGSVGTTLTYTGKGDAIVVQNGRFNRIHDLSLQRTGNTTGSTRGIVITGTGKTGADSFFTEIERVTVGSGPTGGRGFYIGIDIGCKLYNFCGDKNDGGGNADIVDIKHSAFGDGDIGLRIGGYNSTQLSCFDVSIGFNALYGVHLLYGGPTELNWYGGSFGKNKVGVHDESGGMVLLDGIRDENPDKNNQNYHFYEQTGFYGVAVISRYTPANAATCVRPAKCGPLFSITGSNLTVRNSELGGTTTGFDVVEVIGGWGSVVKIENCYINKKQKLLSYDMNTGTADGTRYIFEGNLAFDSLSPTGISQLPNETGRVVWPKMLSDEMLLSTTPPGYPTTLDPAVDTNTATPRTLYTVPTGRTAIITKVIVRNVSTPVTFGLYSFGFNSPSFNDVIVNAPPFLAQGGPTLITILNPKAGAKLGLSGQNFKVLMHTLGVAATTTIEVYGYLN